MTGPYQAPRDLERILRPAMTVDITTFGRSSGLPRRIEIWMFIVNGRAVITGTPGPRDWYANVLANPNLTVHVGPPHDVDLPATAQPVTDAGVRREVFTAPHTSWYLSQTPLEDLMASSPMVELDFGGRPSAGG